MKTIAFFGHPRRLGLGLLLVVGLAAPVSRAQNQRLTEAISAYENFEYQEALDLLEQAAKLPGNSDADLARIHLYTGLIQFTLGDTEAAAQEFAAALRKDYTVAPPADTSPKIVAAFERIKKTIPPPAGAVPPGPVPGPVAGSTAPPPAAGGRVWTWVAAGVGGAALIGGGICGGLAMSAKSDFDSEQWAGPAAGLRDDVESRALAANVLFGVGGAALLTAVVLFFVEDPGTEPAAATETGIRIEPGPLSVQATIRF